jgi:hypothetical protein
MKPAALAQRQKTRALGMKRFVLVTGVLSWGVPMFFVITFVVHRTDLSPKMLAVSALIWLMGGALFGIAMWLLAERQYRKATSA